jgi:superkiller protein 3
MCLGYIFQSSGQWTKAEHEFSQVITNSDDPILAIRAQEEKAWSQARAGDISSGMAGFKTVLEYLYGSESNGHDKARCLWRLGYCHWNLTGMLP